MTLRSALLVLLMGLLLPFAFAPLGVYTFAFVAPAVLLYQWRKSTPTQAFLKGGLFGLGFFGVGVSWVYISIHTYGQANVFISSLITFALVAIMALFPATQGYVLTRFFGKKRGMLFCLAAFPATWVIWEWFRTYPLNGFPWLYLGYSQTNTILRGFAPCLGIYGVSLIVAVMCGCLMLMTSREYRRVKFIAFSIFAVCLLAGWQLSQVQWTQPSGKSLSVSLVQANVNQSLKWKHDQLDDIIQKYSTLTEPYWESSRLIIWPEAAIPAFTHDVRDELTTLNKKALEKKATLLLGILLSDRLSHDYYNGVILLGEDKGQYQKRHLVPFGEYTPAPKLFSFLLNYWKIPMSNFTPGPDQQHQLSVAGVPIALFICYEIAYPNQVLQYIHDSQLLINISDDSWFGESMASSQQVQIAQLRALETGRYVLAASNTGVTAILNPMGQIQNSLPLDKPGVLSADVQPMRGKTPFMRWKNYPVLILLILLLAFAAWDNQRILKEGPLRRR